MRILVTLMALLTLLALPVLVGAQETFVWFYGAGSGDFMDSPPVFAGGMDPGGDITAGSWLVTVWDNTWPTEPTERFIYVWDTFFADNYTPGDQPYWTGYFGRQSGQEHWNGLEIVDQTNGGTLSGACSVEYQVQDLDADGELDDGEFCAGSLKGLEILLLPAQSTGFYDGLIGHGNYFGSFTRECPATRDSWSFGMYLWLESGPS